METLVISVNKTLILEIFFYDSEFTKRPIKMVHSVINHVKIVNILLFSEGLSKILLSQFYGTMVLVFLYHVFSNDFWLQRVFESGSLRDTL